MKLWLFLVEGNSDKIYVDKLSSIMWNLKN